jgi:hypothetical protein
VGVEQLYQLGEVGQGTGEPVDPVDDDDVDLPSADILQEPLQGRAVGRSAGIAAIIIPGAQQGPAVMGLATDIGLGCLMLGVEGVELLAGQILDLGDAETIVERRPTRTAVRRAEDAAVVTGIDDFRIVGREGQASAKSLCKSG